MRCGHSVIVVGVELGRGQSVRGLVVVGSDGGHQYGREMLSRVSGSSDVPRVRGGGKMPIEGFEWSRYGRSGVESRGEQWRGGDRRRSSLPKRRRRGPGESGSSRFEFVPRWPGREHRQMGVSWGDQAQQGYESQ